MPLPVVGNIIQLSGGNIVTSLLKLKDTYGEVFIIYLGSRPVVVITGYKAVKDVLVDRGDDFLGRGDMFIFDAVYKNHGVGLTTDVKRWKELRRFSVMTMRDFGMGKRKIEDHIQNEAQCLVEELKKTKEECFNPRELMNKVSSNIIHSIMFGTRHDYNDKELIRVLHCIQESFFITSSAWGQLFEMFPRIMYFLPGKHQKVISDIEELQHYVMGKVEMNRKTLDPDNPRDYVDAFLMKMEKDKNDPKSEFNLSNLVTSTLQIFFAGVETTSTTLTYALLILMKYPEVLAKICEEIEHNIGQDRSPKVQDRNQMPYTDAVIHEIHRFIDLLPMGVPRKTTRNMEFRGYFLPKDTNIYVFLSSVLKDPSYFPYSNEFDPHNFLDKNGKFKKNDAFLPFSAGKKNCLGEGLVRMDIFIFIVTILQKFQLKSEFPQEDLDVTPVVSGFGNISKPFKMSFISR
ncbi:cytochrome P450 2G1-like [Hyperolius riggenbachi]|uniref:cytochrome P450 2G1-like n=1 Tax=Hyperolius riggenbachi TaxID=752182 RepID=UPI0035A35697